MKKKVILSILLVSFAAFPWVKGYLAQAKVVVPLAGINTQPAYLYDIPESQFIKEPLQPVATANSLNKEKVALGRKLFLDKRLSPANDLSCNSCHPLESGGVDQRSHPVQGDLSLGLVNTLTVYNSANNFRWYWDGRAETLEDQVNESLTSATELGADWAYLLKTLRSVTDYQSDFEKLFPLSGVEKENVIDVIAEFERSLVTPNAPLDLFLHGEQQALTSDQRRGYQLFKGYGCIACHQGGNVGGNMFQLFGVMGNYFDDRQALEPIDLGRFNVTGKEEDKHRFRVPSLRNVALTPPYFHDGSAITLEAAVMVMAAYQLGRPIPIDDARLIVMFLHSLSGSYDGEINR